MNLEDTLTKNEKIIYAEIIKEIEEKEDFFTKSSPDEILAYLSDVCKFNKEEIYNLFKKITSFNNKN